jgi:hypothetical protein
MSSRQDEAALHGLVGRIYEAALDPRLWGEVVASVVDAQRVDKGLLVKPLLSFASTE